MENKKEKNAASHSFYAYTALIFIVAIMMIILAFFGQSNLDKSQENPTHSEGLTITEKSAALSDENLALRDKVSDLSEQLETKNSELIMSQAINEVNSKLLAAQVKAETGDIDGVKLVLSTIDKASLMGDSLTIYEILEAKITAAPVPQQ